MFECCSEISIIVKHVQTIGVIKAFFLPGGLFKFVGAQGTGKNAGLWFAKVYQYPG